VLGTKPILSTQTVNSNLPGRVELYALVTDAEAEALRGGGPLVPPAAPMTAQSDAVKLLDKILPVATAARKPVIEALKPRFLSVRRAWPNPWALRLVDHPGSEHMNIVRLVLRSGAWIARITDGSIAVVDTNNATIGPELVAANPEQVAAIFYEVNQQNYLTVGGLNACEEGRREFVIGDDAMIEEWSLGTPDILTRLDEDLILLEEFFKVARNCGAMTLPSGSFRATTVCTSWMSYNVFSELSAYVWSLSTPNELYKPSPQNLASLIEALQGDRFEPNDEYVVNPEPPLAGGAPNQGGAGGADSAGAGGAN
jgi:hypothetical protein